MDAFRNFVPLFPVIFECYAVTEKLVFFTSSVCSAPGCTVGYLLDDVCICSDLLDSLLILIKTFCISKTG